MLRNVWSTMTHGTYRQGARWPRVAGTGVQCALSLLMLSVTVAGFGCAGARVDVAQQAPSDVPQPDFIIVERFGVSPEDVKLDRGLSAQALRGFQGRLARGARSARPGPVMEEEMRCARGKYPGLRGFLRAHSDAHDGPAAGAVSERG